MAGFAAEDLFLKKTTTYLPLGQSLILFGLMGVLIILRPTSQGFDPKVFFSCGGIDWLCGARSGHAGCTQAFI